MNFITRCLFFHLSTYLILQISLPSRISSHFPQSFSNYHSVTLFDVGAYAFTILFGIGGAVVSIVTSVSAVSNFTYVAAVANADDVTSVADVLDLTPISVVNFSLVFVCNGGCSFSAVASFLPVDNFEILMLLLCLCRQVLLRLIFFVIYIFSHCT